MAEEPTLPPLPAVAWDAGTQDFADRRKRARDQRFAPPPAFANSSDPAMFSSDDDPHVENYTQGKHRKRRYVGSWFQQHPTSSDSTFSEDGQPLPKKKKRTYRGFDSAIWMGSDGGSSEIEDEDTPRQPLRLQPPRPTFTISKEEAAARDVIQAAINAQNPTISLSSSGLTTIRNATISPLSVFDTMPIIDESYPFETRKASISVFLSNNPLRCAPGALFNLENLTILSLRNTEISELPPCIGNLRNLKDLNVSLTRLRYLPGELLDLMKFPSKLESLNIHPNPFHRPDDFEYTSAVGDDWDESCTSDPMLVHGKLINRLGQIRHVWFDKQFPLATYPSTSTVQGQPPLLWETRAIARSPVQYSDSRGVVVSKFKLPKPSPTEFEQNSTLNLQTEDLGSSPAPPYSRRDLAKGPGNPSRVPSLFEVALQSCAKSGQLSGLSKLLPSDAPPHMAEILDQIADQSEQNGNYGHLPCSVCGRQVVVPTAQWIEWWQISHITAAEADPPILAIEPLSNSIERSEVAVPFLRRGCSWKCVPKPMKAGQRLPGNLRIVAELEYSVDIFDLR
ncbi:hypothetical protein GGS26DRAFT_431549 [Hypomontagnella submonticulosa]|nr:hypothetical protein GGS26DRAFT_431549 [Hypomontagnella submonticulosa]